MPANNRRTVGELLADSDALARDTLLDVSPNTGPAMARAWGQVVQSAAQLWAVLPPASLAPASGPDPMVRLRVLGEGLGRSTAGQWPGPGPQDQRLLEIAGNLSHTRELIERYGRDVQPAGAEARRDIAAARAPGLCTRCMWALTVQLLRSGNMRLTLAIACVLIHKGAGPSTRGRPCARSRRPRPWPPGLKSSSSLPLDMSRPTLSLPAFLAKFGQPLDHRGCSQR